MTAFLPSLPRPFRHRAHRASVGAASVAVAVVAGIVAFGSTPAHADVTLATETTVTGLPAAARALMGTRAPDPGKPLATTTYYKGDKQRVEGADGVILYDGGTDTLTTLNPESKTYTTRKLYNVMRRLGSSPLHTYLKVDTKQNAFAAATDSQPIAGQPTKVAAYTYAVHEYPDPAIGDALPIPDATIVCHGQWSYTDAVQLGAGLARAERSGFILNFVLSGVGALMMGPGLDTLADQVVALKGLPLGNKMEFVFTPKDKKAAEEAGLPSFDAPVVVSSVTKSVSVAPLDDALFLIPPGYMPAPTTDAPAAGNGASAPPVAPPTK